MKVAQVPFSAALLDVSGGNIKVPKSEYLHSGAFPVIDQGKEFASGYTNETKALFRGADLPVIIFGDHTRVFKYVDEPFAMGADGIKVLKPKQGYHPKFIFHALRQLRIPDAGYDRHFKYLRRTQIPVIPIEQQKRVATILDSADAVRAKRRASIALLDAFLGSVFLDMFGDPATNPKGWPLNTCGELCERITVGIVVKPASYYRPTGIPALRSLNIKPNRIVLENLVFFSEQDNKTRLAKTRLKTGDVVLVRTGQPGTAAVVPKNCDGINAIDLLIASPTQDKLHPEYLAQFFNSSEGKRFVLASQRGQIQQHFNVEMLRKAKVPTPPLHLQEHFAAIIYRYRKLLEIYETNALQMDNLFKSLQQQAFSAIL